MARQLKLPSLAAVEGVMRAAVEMGYRIKNIILRRDGYVIEIADVDGGNQDGSPPAPKKPPLVL